MSKQERKITTSISGIQYEGWPIDGKPLARFNDLSEKGQAAALRRRKRNTKKQERGRRNRARRAEINATFRGEAGSKRATEYHTQIKALSLGTL